MKAQVFGKILLSISLAFVLGGAITQVRGQGVVTIHSTGDVVRGKTGSFVLNMDPAPMQWGGLPVNFSISGTAIAGVDYVPLVSPVRVQSVPPPPQCMSCRPRGLGVILVKALPDPRASFFPQPYSVVVTLEPGFGYAIGEPSSATIMINP